MTEDSLQMAFARRLTQALEEEKMQQKDLACALEVNPTQVYRWRTGQAFPNSLDMVGRIAKEVKRSPVWLMFGIDTGHKEQESILAFLALPESDMDVVRGVIDAMASKNK